MWVDTIFTAPLRKHVLEYFRLTKDGFNTTDLKMKKKSMTENLATKDNSLVVLNFKNTCTSKYRSPFKRNICCFKKYRYLYEAEFHATKALTTSCV